MGRNSWSGAELIWEGVFAIVASLIISIMGAALLRVSKLQAKWRVKLTKALEAKDNKASNKRGRFKTWCEKYAMFILPFITIIREGLEAVVFMGGVGLGLKASSIPLAVVCGVAAGSLIGYFVYKCVFSSLLPACVQSLLTSARFRGGMYAPIRIFLIISTCALYLVAAALMSRGVWFLEANTWNVLTGGDAAEGGSGPGTYDIRQSVWHVNCCNPKLNGGGGWGVFNSILGWQNSATYGSVISYNLYWLAVIVAFVTMRFQEKNGRWPLMRAPARAVPVLSRTSSDSSSGGEAEMVGKAAGYEDGTNVAVKRLAA
jgi:high-affinity iron transporter